MKLSKFQAKDIQNIIGIPKYRYEYIASKIGVKPEIEEVEKTGHTHLYSFKNLLEFGVIDLANDMGMKPKTIRDMISFLNNTNVFDRETISKTRECSLYFFKIRGGNHFSLKKPVSFDWLSVIDLGRLKYKITNHLKMY